VELAAGEWIHHKGISLEVLLFPFKV